MTKKPTEEWIKALIGIFATLVTGAIIYLFASNLSMQKEIVELKANQKHMQEYMPKVTEALEKHTTAINDLRVAIEGLK
jgi:uncharacterized membrane-anchored protein YhcB (DUF1043 family)